MQNISAILYLIAAVLFIFALKGLSSPVTARRGNMLGVVGMVIAIVTTFAIMDKPVFGLIAAAMIAGGAIGAYKARTVQMTGMPELVAAMRVCIIKNG